jgi:hypothetical protein
LKEGKKMDLEKKWKKIEKQTMFYFDAILLVLSVVGLCTAVFLLFVGFHNFDLSVNMLLCLGEYNWREGGDVISYKIENGTVEYNTLPYPVLYMNGINFVICGSMIGALSAFCFGLSFRGLLRRGAEWSTTKRF